MSDGLGKFLLTDTVPAMDKPTEIAAYLTSFLVYPVAAYLFGKWDFYKRNTDTYSDTVASIQVAQYYVFSFACWVLLLTVSPFNQPIDWIEWSLANRPLSLFIVMLFPATIIGIINFAAATIFTYWTFRPFVVRTANDPIRQLGEKLSGELIRLPKQITQDLPIKIRYLLQIARHWDTLKKSAEDNKREICPTFFLVSSDTSLHERHFLVSSETSLHDKRAGELAVSWHTVIYCYMQQHWGTEFKAKGATPPFYSKELNDHSPDELNRLNTNFKLILDTFKSKLANNACRYFDGTDTAFSKEEITSGGLFHDNILGIRVWFPEPRALEVWIDSIKSVSARELFFSSPRTQQEVILNVLLPRSSWMRAHKLAVALIKGKAAALKALEGKLVTLKEGDAVGLVECKDRTDSSAFEIPVGMTAFITGLKTFIGRTNSRAVSWGAVTKELKAMLKRAEDGFDPRRDLVAVGCGLGITGSDEDLQALQGEYGMGTDGYSHRALQFHSVLLFAVSALCYQHALPFFMVATALTESLGDVRDVLKTKLSNPTLWA